MNIQKEWKIAALVFCLLMGIYLLTYSGMGVTDDEQLFAVLTGSLAEGQGYNALPLFGNDRLRGSSGSVEPLHSLLGIPIYLLAESVNWGRAQAQHLPAGIYTAFSAALLAVMVLRRGYRQSSAVTLALAFGLGTIALPYARTNFREPLAMLCLTGAGFCVENLRIARLPVWKHFLTLVTMTILAGLAALTKLTCGFCLPFFLAAAWLNLKRGARLPHRIIFLLLSLCLLAAASGLLVLNAWVPAFAISRYSLDFFTYMTRSLPRLAHDAFWPAIAGMLFSPGKGLLVYSPVLLLAFYSLFSDCLPGAQAAIRRWLSSSKPTTENTMLPASHSQDTGAVEANSDRMIAFGSLAALMAMQALIYNKDWWGITWSTRALLPALPLLMLACLPALDAGLHSPRRSSRILVWLLLASSALIQLGRVLVPDPAYVGWLVGTSGQKVNTAYMWKFNLMPLWRHWQLAFQGIPNDIAWLHLEGIDQSFIGLFLLAIILSSGASFYLLTQKKSASSIVAVFLLAVTLGCMPASLAIAKHDQRYYGGNQNYRAACDWLEENAEEDSLLLVDAYLKPLWWYTFNFGYANVDWVGLPYEHAKPLSGDLYYPRLRELADLLDEYRAQNTNIYLLESISIERLTYHAALENFGFIFTPEAEFESDNSGSPRIYTAE